MTPGAGVKRHLKVVIFFTRFGVYHLGHNRPQMSKSEQSTAWL